MVKFDRTIWTLWIIGLFLVIGLAPKNLAAQPGSALDIEKELARPGVKLVVVEFFATWCEPCMAAVPELESQA